MNEQRWSWVGCALLLGLASAASCRDYGPRRGLVAGEGGAHVGGAAVSASGEHGGEGVIVIVESGGAGGAPAAAGFGGMAGGAEAGEAGASEAGADGAPASPTDTGVLGAVRLFIDGQPVCAGTLLNNHWLITADSCVDATAGPIEVRYGADSAAPDQVEMVSELVRFPGNDGTAENRGRDLLLLGLARPIRVQGRDSGFFQPLFSLAHAGALLGVQVCAGWDLTPDDDEGDGVLRTAQLTPFGVDLSSKLGAREAGDKIWLSKQPGAGATPALLPTDHDLGSGCFYRLHELDVLTSVTLSVPDERRDGRDNPNLEAVTVGVSQEAIRSWVEATLLTQPDFLPLPPVGPIAASWSDPTTLQVVAVDSSSGSLLWFTRQAGVWGDPVDVGAPTGAALSKVLRPAGLWQASGDVELFAVDEQGRLWWRREQGGTWGDWDLVAVADSAITSGLSVGQAQPGHFHLVARGSRGELRHAEYEDGAWHAPWHDFGDLLLGAPTIDVIAGDRVNVFYAHADGSVQQTYLLEGWFTQLYTPAGQIASPPAAGHWTVNLFDFVARSPAGNLARYDYRVGWTGPRWLDTGVPLPGDTAPVVALRQPGHGDIFVSMSDGLVWHVEWPRRPGD